MAANPKPVDDRRSRPSPEPAGEPPAAARMGAAPLLVHRRIAFALLLAALLGVGLLHLVLVRRFAAQTGGRAERAAMISARSLAAVAEAHRGEGEALTPALKAWLAEHPKVRAARIASVDNRSIEASTFADDLKEDPAFPRRMQRPEKPLYDLGQELAVNVDTNRQENTKHEPEVRVERKADGTFLIAAPIEKEGSVTGFAQIDAAPEVIEVKAPGIWVAIAFALAPFVVVFALSYALRDSRKLLMIAVAAVLLFVTLFAYQQWATGSLAGGARTAEQRIAERVSREAAIAAKLAPGAERTASTWDADIYRQPRRIDVAKSVAEEKENITEAGYGIGVASLVLLFFVGLGYAAKTRHALVRDRQALTYVTPALLAMLLLVFFPFIYSMAISLTSQNIYSVNKPLSELWIGFTNYSEILGDFNPIRYTAAGRQANYANFYYTLFFTVAWTIVNVTIGVSVGLLLALILNTKGLRFKGAYRVLLILPWALPNYITALIFKGMFHQQFGAINQIIQIFGGKPLAWFDHPLTSFAAVVACNGWLSFPFMMVTSLGALQSIPADLYEAARVDGASRWQQFTAITLPSLKPALVPAIILSVVWTFNMFNIIYLVSAGMPAGSTEILITQAYKFAFEQYRYGYAAAYSTVIFAILLIYGLFQNRMTRATEAIA